MFTDLVRGYRLQRTRIIFKTRVLSFSKWVQTISKVNICERQNISSFQTLYVSKNSLSTRKTKKQMGTTIKYFSCSVRSVMKYLTIQLTRYACLWSFWDLNVLYFPRYFQLQSFGRAEKEKKAANHQFTYSTHQRKTSLAEQQKKDVSKS